MVGSLEGLGSFIEGVQETKELTKEALEAREIAELQARTFRLTPGDGTELLVSGEQLNFEQLRQLKEFEEQSGILFFKREALRGRANTAKQRLEELGHTVEENFERIQHPYKQKEVSYSEAYSAFKQLEKEACHYEQISLDLEKRLESCCYANAKTAYFNKQASYRTSRQNAINRAQDVQKEFNGFLNTPSKSAEESFKVFEEAGMLEDSPKPASEIKTKTSVISSVVEESKEKVQEAVEETAKENAKPASQIKETVKEAAKENTDNIVKQEVKTLGMKSLEAIKGHKAIASIAAFSTVLLGAFTAYKLNGKKNFDKNV